MKEEFQQQITELIEVHKGLSKIQGKDSYTIVSGTLPFEAFADGLEVINESFEIELTIPHSFPDSLPIARELGGRIESSYDHLNPDSTLCLAVPIEQRQIFFEDPTLIGFVNFLVIPYLYGYSFWKKHGYHPFGEAEHGNDGILSHYIDTLNLPNEISALAIICYLFEHGYRGHHDCPCGSGLRVRKCHGPALRALHEHHTLQTLLCDFVAVFGACHKKLKSGQINFPKHLRQQLVRIANNPEFKRTKA